MSLVARDVSPMCNDYMFNGFPNPKYPDGFQHICRDSSDGGEYFTYFAKEMDGHSLQHQEQFRIQSLFPYFYYGLIEPSGYWQFQEETRFNLGDFSNGGISKTHEFAQRHPNGAWQHEYAWRNVSTDYFYYCYAQSDFDENGAPRNGTFFCNLPDSQISGDHSPVPLKDPKFKDIPIRDPNDIHQTVPLTTNPTTTVSVDVPTTVQTTAAFQTTEKQSSVQSTSTMTSSVTISSISTTTTGSAAQQTTQTTSFAASSLSSSPSAAASVTTTSIPNQQSNIPTPTTTLHSSTPSLSASPKQTQTTVKQTTILPNPPTYGKPTTAQGYATQQPKQGIYSSSKKLFNLSILLLVPYLF
ncbi:hypothetical protein HDV06_004184 [Boothiomyces sp. JEL0866]|nr:hypothetical protein HDV06_004184 [Boothiomyces sp. JEL0866]